jgi:hypothetical protein
MRITQATLDDKAVLLSLMREAFEQENSASVEEWAKTETAITILLSDPQAGEACLIFSDTEPIGYIIMCRGFSLDYGGYFTWIEESHLRNKAEQGRFRDQRFSP